MSRTAGRVLAFWLASWVWISVAMATAPEAPPGQGARILLDAYNQALSDGDLETAGARLGEALAHPSFGELPEDMRYASHSAAGYLLLRRGDVPGAYRHFRKATQFSQASLEDWRLRTLISVEMGWLDDAADGLRGMFQHSPKRLTLEDRDVLAQTIQRMDTDSESRFLLLRTLFDGHYTLPRLGEPDGLWLDLALLHAKRGETDAARAVLSRIVGPSTWVQILADRRFDGIRDPEMGVDDLPRLAAGHVADLRASAILNPGWLDVQNELATAMLVAGENEDVVALAREIDEALATSRVKGGPFVDKDENLPWIYNRAGEALVRLDRKDDALAMYRAAARVPGPDTASHTLNLAQHLASMGRAQEALDVARDASRMSPFGRMVLVSVQYRAARQLGNEDAARDAMDYLAEHRSDNEGAYADARRESGDLDAAAAALVQRLDDPGERSAALVDVQDFQRTPRLDARYDADMDALTARDDVKAAIERNGRKLSLPIWRDW